METSDNVICRMLLGDLKVDFMPDDPKILSFSNRWYPKSMETAALYRLEGDLNIRLIRPEYFIATKIEAYKGRGNNDPLSSHDIEDLLNLFDGRKELVEEIRAADNEVKVFISEELNKLLSEDGFEYAVQSASSNNPDRESLIFERLDMCI